MMKTINEFYESPSVEIVELELEQIILDGSSNTEDWDKVPF